ncbi:hypothetical protein G039_0306770 [Pseudomonas aeruginosa VRFPA01]|nr:hypothetical protein G039_0306770 [Pseudomonas aeruginosa VRFPA01]
MGAATGQAPEQEAVDGAEAQLAAFGALAGTGHVVEDPAQLGGGEIRIDQQPGARTDVRLVAGGLEFGAVVGGTAVLPDDGRVDQVAAGGVPDQRGLALVGDTDGGPRNAAQVSLRTRRTAFCQPA